MLASSPAFAQAVSSALRMAPSFHLQANPGHSSPFSFSTASPWKPSMIIPGWYRLLSCVLSELLSLPVAKVCAVGAIIARSVVLMTYCRLLGRDYTLFSVVSPAPSRCQGHCRYKEAYKEQDSGRATRE